MFIKFSGKCGQKHEIMDKNMKLWTNISSLLMNIHEHSSEPRKCEQYCPNLKNNCPHFLGSLEYS